jgi:hypothetical protein
MLIGWFFARMKFIYGNKFASQFANDQDLALTKREWGTRIIQHTRMELNSAFEETKRLMEAGDKRYEWPNVAAVLGLITQSWESRCHKPFEPAVPLIEDKTAIEANQREASKTLGGLKDLFKNTPEPKDCY